MDPKNPKEMSLKQIRTFQGDVAEALNAQEESLVSIQQAEHSRQDSSKATSVKSSEISAKRKRFFLLLLGTLILVTLGTIGIWFAYNEFVTKTKAPITIVPANRFLAPDIEETLSLAGATRQHLINAVSLALENVSPGEIKHLILSFSTSEFFQILETRAPGYLLRSFDPLFMLGTLGESPFIIIKLTSFQNAFSGMLEWEENIYDDLGALFAATPTSVIATSTPTAPELTFIDVTDQNKDLRVLKQEEKILILYSFLDANMLIITDRIETLRVLVDRLTREKLSR